MSEKMQLTLAKAQAEGRLAEFVALHKAQEGDEAILREVRSCTTEHGGASKALRIINAALSESGQHPLDTGDKP